MGKTYETSESAEKDFLKTRYYKTNIELIYKFLEEDLKKNSYNIISINKDYGEIAASHETHDIVVKLFQYSATEVAVDLFLDSHFLFDFGKSKKIIEEFYERLNKNFNLIGVALHKN